MTLWQRLIRSSKALSLTVGAVVSQLPGITYFYALIPPYFGAFHLLATGGTLAIFLYAYLRASGTRTLVRGGITWVGLSIVLAIIFTPLLSAWTVPPPDGWPQNGKFQIGFGMSKFSLTDPAIQKAKEFKIDNPSDLMLAFGAFDDAKLSRVWKQWTIVVAGMTLVVVFVASYVCWVLGIAYLAKSLGREGGS